MRNIRCMLSHLITTFFMYSFILSLFIAVFEYMGVTREASVVASILVYSFSVYIITKRRPLASSVVDKFMESYVRRDFAALAVFLSSPVFHFLLIDYLAYRGVEYLCNIFLMVVRNGVGVQKKAKR